MNPSEIETLVHGRLRALPHPRAPHTLLPRVMESVRAWSARPWYERAWLTWPAVWQAASLLLWVAGIAFGVWLLPAAERVVGSLPAATAAAVASAAFEADILSVATAMRLLWRALVEPVMPYALTFIALACLAGTAAAAALNHLVLQSTAGRMAKP